MSTPSINETHDIKLRSWVDAANDGKSDFPIQNLPYGVFRRAGKTDDFHGGVAIGDQILDLAAASRANLFSGDAAEAAQLASAYTLNSFMDADPSLGAALRLALSRLLREDSALEGRARACMLPMKDAEMGLPATIGDYTDFFASVFHATNTGSMFRPDNPLLPNYKHVPIAYHGRASSIRVGSSVAPQAFPRPLGQTKPADAPAPLFGPSKRMDYELEVGVWIGHGNALGSRIPVTEAQQHVFGLCLLNDWSARDIQGWEYQPLGPFLAKNFASTISPWIVTTEALAPFRAPAFARPEGDPQPMPYLDSEDNRNSGAVDMQLEVLLLTQKMRDDKQAPTHLSSSNFKDSYWTLAQMVAHHTVGGCDLHAGDFFGSGTMSGPGKDQYGSLLELSWGGKNELTLPNGETRTFLQDGDTVILRAHCERAGYARIGFGDCAGTVLPAVL
ncbi:MAG: fumarylacetoacetase [Betaproteobacteria bacterium]|nr:fumarylacetoacetase [Betaproteobacteria bacterium]